MKMAERLMEHTRHLPPLVVGDQVRIQNQTGPHPTKWDKTGIIIEVRQFDQYVVRVDGSGRVTVRNRKFLRKYLPVVPRHPHSSLDTDLAYRPLAPAKPSSPLSPAKPASQCNMEPPSTLLTPSARSETPPDNPLSSPQHLSSSEKIARQRAMEKHDTAIPTDNPSPVIPSIPTNVPQRLPRALMRLLPHNPPGQKEITPPLLVHNQPLRRSTRQRAINN